MLPRRETRTWSPGGKPALVAAAAADDTAGDCCRTRRRIALLEDPPPVFRLPALGERFFVGVPIEERSCLLRRRSSALASDISRSSAGSMFRANRLGPTRTCVSTLGNFSFEFCSKPVWTSRPLCLLVLPHPPSPGLPEEGGRARTG